MIKIFKCNGKNYIKKLNSILQVRKKQESDAFYVVKKIIKNLKKNKIIMK